MTALKNSKSIEPAKKTAVTFSLVGKTDDASAFSALALCVFRFLPDAALFMANRITMLRRRMIGLHFGRES